MTADTDWVERAAALDPQIELFIDGSFRKAHDRATFVTRAPRNGAAITEVCQAGPYDVDDAVTAARRAFTDGRWATASPGHRKRVLTKLAELIRDNAEELALLESLDVGKPISDTLRVDVPACARTFEWYGETVDKWYGEVAPTAAYTLATVTREPIGVVAAVVPWNYPLVISAWKLAPALAVGNSVILKPAEQTPLSALRLAELAAAAGIPDGVLNVLPGDGPVTGGALGMHDEIDKVTFTGSAEVGRAFLHYSADSNNKQVALELGGKSPQLVLADAEDLSAAARAIARAVFYNAGQICHAGSRLLVDDSVHDALLDQVVTVATELRLGDPLDPATQIGAIVSEQHLQRVLEYLAIAREERTVVRCGGTSTTVEGAGWYVQPTVLDGVASSSRVAREEILGPVLTVTGFRGVQEAVQLANSTGYGLAASVWTSHLGTAHRVSRALRAGTVWVNTFDVADVITPFGGSGDFGYGRDRSLHALESYTRLKTTWVHIGR